MSAKTERTVKGILGTKLGMTQLWDASNKVVPVTVIQAGPCVVTQVRTPDSDGYSAVQLGFGAISMTVTGTSLPFSFHTWVMPSFVPSRPLEVLLLMSATSNLRA